MPALSRRAALLSAAAGVGVLALAGCSGAPDVAAGSSAASAPGSSAPGSSAPGSSSPPPSSTPRATPGFDHSAHSISDPASLWVVVNKRRPLPSTYAPDVTAVPVPHTNPPLLRQAANAAVVAMFAAARKDGVSLASNSTYRSYTDQRSVYNGIQQQLGTARADLLSAHPGCSEHQTGLAIDIGPLNGRCSLEACMGDLPEGRWLAANAWRSGFLLRYPSDKTTVTGYQYEPWHFRYLGVPLATELHRSRVTTLEEFFGLPAAPGYA